MPNTPKKNVDLTEVGGYAKAEVSDDIFEVVEISEFLVKALTFLKIIPKIDSPIKLKTETPNTLRLDIERIDPKKLSQIGEISVEIAKRVALAIAVITAISFVAGAAVGSCASNNDKPDHPQKNNDSKIVETKPNTDDGRIFSEFVIPTDTTEDKA